MAKDSVTQGRAKLARKIIKRDQEGRLGVPPWDECVELAKIVLDIQENDEAYKIIIKAWPKLKEKHDAAEAEVAALRTALEGFVIITELIGDGDTASWVRCALCGVAGRSDHQDGSPQKKYLLTHERECPLFTTPPSVPDTTTSLSGERTPVGKSTNRDTPPAPNKLSMMEEDGLPLAHGRKEDDDG